MRAIRGYMEALSDQCFVWLWNVVFIATLELISDNNDI